MSAKGLAPSWRQIAVKDSSDSVPESVTEAERLAASASADVLLEALALKIEGGLGGVGATRDFAKKARKRLLAAGWRGAHLEELCKWGGCFPLDADEERFAAARRFFPAEP